MGLYPFRFLDSLNIDQITVNTHHLPDKIVEMYSQQPFYRGALKFSHETDQILGSAGGFKEASKHFAKSDDSTVLLLNADEVFFGADRNFLAEAYAQHKKTKARATIVVMKHL